MPTYVTGKRIKLAVERLRRSRCSGGMVNFLILKRAVSLDPDNTAKLSTRDASFQRAITELTWWPEDESDETEPRPFVDVFGSMNAKNEGTKKRKYRSNGPSDTLRNGTWSAVVEILEGERSKAARLKDDYRADLARLTLTSDVQRPMPLLRDAAVWYFRRQDVESIVEGPQADEEVEDKLAEAFCARIGLDNDDVAILFAH